MSPHPRALPYSIILILEKGIFMDTRSGSMKSRKEYWKDWYWNKGGREKVQYSRKVTQPKNYKKLDYDTTSKKFVGTV